jgi:hypothetical protein
VKPPFTGAAVAVAFIGVAFGVEGDLLALLITGYLGTRHFGRILGLVQAAFFLDSALGPLLLGLGCDLLGSYDPVIPVLMGVLVAGAILIATLGRYVHPAVSGFDRLAARDELAAAEVLTDIAGSGDPRGPVNRPRAGTCGRTPDPGGRPPPALHQAAKPPIREATTRLQGETMTEQNPWPMERAGRSTVLAQFGQARADLMQWALTTGDVLADAVVAEMHETGMRQARPVVDQGIREGLESLADPPPALKALLRQTESVPAYVDDSLLDQGPMTFYTSPPPVHIVALNAGSLIRVYESPSISKVLTTTGRLVDAAQRRIQETGAWPTQVMLPGGLRVGQPGYVATLEVRMLHAHMRGLALNRGYDSSADGSPINQVDLGRTWMDFTP